MPRVTVTAVAVLGRPRPRSSADRIPARSPCLDSAASPVPRRRSSQSPPPRSPAPRRPRTTHTPGPLWPMIARTTASAMSTIPTARARAEKTDRPSPRRPDGSSSRIDSGEAGAQTAVEPESAAAQPGAEEAEDDPRARPAVAEDRPDDRLGDEHDPHRAGQSGEDGQAEPPPAGRQFEQNRQRRGHEWIA